MEGGRRHAVEQALIGALRARYPQPEAVEDCSVWNEPYADSMRTVYELAPDDPDVAALYADALMNLTPWQLWDVRTGEPAEGARTLAAKAALERSIELDDNLPYDEPWGRMQPTRHAYGALLLEQGRVTEAEAVYRADLGLDETLPRAVQHPGNVWALHGFHECLVRLGREGEARIVAQQLKIAPAPDVPIEASCLCRLDVGTGDPDAGCC